MDAAGNAWVAGYTGSALDNNTHFGDWDIFLMKFDALGGHLWTRQRGGPGWDVAYALQAKWWDVVLLDVLVSSWIET